MTLTRVFAASVLVLLSALAPTAVHREVPEATPRRAVGTGVVLGGERTQPALGVRASTAAQYPEEVEAALRLDQPVRRLIQQGLSKEGFDPGAPDGLFGPRTRAAIRDWQSSRGATATGYLTDSEVELLRGAGTFGTATSESDEAVSLPPAPAAVTAAATVATDGTSERATRLPAPSEPGESPDASSPTIAGLVPAPDRCDEWNTVEFFASATAGDVSACLAAGADTGARDRSWGRTPLHFAALLNDSPEVIRTLLAAGAALEAQDDDGSTPLYFAYSRRGVRSGRDGDNVAVLATLVEVLLASGTNATARDDRGATHLHYVAAGHADPAATEALLAAGADVAAQTRRGDTPLHWAARYNENPAVVELLLAAGADIAAQGSATPLHFATRNENPAIVELLLAAGADVAAQDQDFGDGETALHWAARYKREPCSCGAPAGGRRRRRGAGSRSGEGGEGPPVQLPDGNRGAPALGGQERESRSCGAPAGGRRRCRGAGQ